MSSIGSEVGGKAAGSLDVNQSQYPFFTSPGGVTPEQSALAEYDYGQNLTQGQAQFEGSDQGGGPSLSTMASQIAGGANIHKALNLASMSDVNQGAELSAYDNAINIDQQNNQNALAERQTNLQSLVGQVGNQQGSAGLNAGLAAPLPGSSTA
jgi:hypothetical protein